MWRKRSAKAINRKWLPPEVILKMKVAVLGVEADQLLQESHTLRLPFAGIFLL
jgi:hypothetical protein